MQIEIDPLSDVPLYQQLRDRVVEGIAAGRLRDGDQLRPVRQLAAEFGINVATVGKGYDLLRAEGLARTNRAAGTVVAVSGWHDRERADWRARLATALAEAVAQGEEDEEILGAAREVLGGFAAERASGGGGASGSGGASGAARASEAPQAPQRRNPDRPAENGRR